MLRDPPRLLDAVRTMATSETPEGVRPLDPIVIIDCGGLCLVLDTDGDWYMGQSDGEQVVRCWASYGPELASALANL